MECTDFQRDAALGGETYLQVEVPPSGELDVIVSGDTSVRLYCTSSYDSGVWSLQVRTRFMR
ncbi:MAG: hypothetical protein EKK55_12125, partial [Rhodocyclaceae bacterium]